MNAARSKILNAILFQVGWFSCIFLSFWPALVITTIVLGVHLKLAEDYKNELKIIFPVGCLGFILDWFFAKLGFIDLNVSGGPVFYLFLLWLLFASTLNSSLKYLMNKPLSAALAGALAPLSYMAAEKIGRVKYAEETLGSMLLHAVMWSLYMLIVHKVYFSGSEK